MSRGSREPEHIKKILGDFLRESGLRGKLGKKEIFTIWPEIVGPDIASHTRITAFRKGVLSVAVDSASHFYELTNFFESEIREKLNQGAPKNYVSKINFHLDLV